MAEPVGLIAGNGQLPLFQAAGIRAAGRPCFAIGLAGQYDDQLPGACDRFRTVGLLRLGQWIRTFRGWGVGEVVMIGGVRKATMYDPLRFVRQIPDLRTLRLWYRVLKQDRRDQTVLAALADELEREGITLIDSTTYIPDHLATPGSMSRVQPTAKHTADIAFGWPILMQMNDLDIGQAIAVKDGDVIAVEAIEGTDAMIQRAGELCRSRGWTLLKGPRPDKDLRFDVPTVGVRTIEGLAAAGGRCLALAAGRTLLADRPAVLAAADKAGIAIVGV